MNIAVNTRLLLKGKLEGIGWFMYESLKRIVMNHPEHTFYFIFDRKYSGEFIFAENVRPVVMYPQARHPFLYKIWFDWQMPRMLKKIKADVFLSPDGYSCLNTDVPCLPVIHDINFAHRPEDLPFIDRWYYNRYFPKFAHTASRIATVSEYSKSDIVETYGIDPSKIDVVYNGANISYVPITQPEAQKTRAEFANGKEYFVFVGSLHPRKNIARLVKAFSIFKQQSASDMKLVIVGEAMFMTEDIKQALQSSQYAEDVIFTGRLSTEALHKVLASALAMSFVPLFEGFGIPILEAMFAGIPVVCSNTTSMPEVGGDAVLYVDPYSVESIADGLTKIAGDPDFRNDLLKKAELQKVKFSWDATSEKLWDSVRKIIE